MEPPTNGRGGMPAAALLAVRPRGGGSGIMDEACDLVSSATRLNRRTSFVMARSVGEVRPDPGCEPGCDVGCDDGRELVSVGPPCEFGLDAGCDDVPRGEAPVVCIPLNVDRRGGGTAGGVCCWLDDDTGDRLDDNAGPTIAGLEIDGRAGT